MSQQAADRLSMVWRQPHSGCRTVAGRTHSPLREGGEIRDGWICTYIRTVIQRKVDEFMLVLTVIVLNGDGSHMVVTELHSPTGICQDTELHLE